LSDLQKKDEDILTSVAGFDEMYRRLQDNTVDLSLHTRREAGTQRHGRQALSYPCSLDSGNPWNDNTLTFPQT
jgi:hypothetical protein